MLSGYGTVPTAAAMPTIMQRKKVFLSLFALAANDQFDYDRYFQLPAQRTECESRILQRAFSSLPPPSFPKPQTVALVETDTEFSVLALEGARENAKKHGIRIVYDHPHTRRTPLSSAPIVRSIKSTAPIWSSSRILPAGLRGHDPLILQDSLGAKMVGGGMIAFSSPRSRPSSGPCSTISSAMTSMR